MRTNLLRVCLRTLAWVLITAFGAPLSWWAVQGLQAYGYLSYLCGFGFDAYLSRIAQVSLALFCIPAITRGALVISPLKPRPIALLLKASTKGFLVAATLMFASVLILSAQGSISFRHALTLRASVACLGTAVLIAFIEEIIFRGLLFASLWRHLPCFVAAAISASLFAVLHLIRSSRHGGHVWSGPINIMTGFERGLYLLSDVLNPWAAPALVGTLVTLGIALAVATARTRGVAWPMGLHAGIVFGMKVQLLTFTTRTVPTWWLSSNDPRCGIAPFLVMFVLLMLVVMLPKAWVHAPVMQRTREEK